MRMLAILAVQGMGLREYAVVASNQWCVSALFKPLRNQRQGSSHDAVLATFYRAFRESIHCLSVIFMQ
jgi:hypothetical protein